MDSSCLHQWTQLALTYTQIYIMAYNSVICSVDILSPKILCTIIAFSSKSTV